MEFAPLTSLLDGNHDFSSSLDHYQQYDLTKISFTQSAEFGFHMTHDPIRLPEISHQLPTIQLPPLPLGASQITPSPIQTLSTTHTQALMISSQSSDNDYFDITPFITLSQERAAKKLGIPKSTLSKRWREATCNRKWPYRQLCKVDREIKTLIHNMQNLGGGADSQLQANLATLMRLRQEESRSVLIKNITPPSPKPAPLLLETSTNSPLLPHTTNSTLAELISNSNANSAVALAQSILRRNSALNFSSASLPSSTSSLSIPAGVNQLQNPQLKNVIIGIWNESLTRTSSSET